jgi:hypothetical protein
MPRSGGKTDTCQSAAMIGISGAKGYGLSDYRLYMLQIWFSDDYVGSLEIMRYSRGTEVQGAKLISRVYD